LIEIVTTAKNKAKQVRRPSAENRSADFKPRLLYVKKKIAALASSVVKKKIPE
jgi:hypothetical protein